MIKIGTRVKTASELDRRDYTLEAHKLRKTNTSGIVVAEHTGHGLCYEVIHDGGGYGVYDPDELSEESSSGS